MNLFSLPYFGQIDTAALNEYYSAETALNGKKVRLDINFDKNAIDETLFRVIKDFLENIEHYNKKNKSNIENNFKEKGESAEYINFYFDELSHDELAGIISQNDKNSRREEQLLNKLRLIRVGLYPDGKHGVSYFGVFDYSIDIDGQPCNQLLVVKTNQRGNLDHIAWES